MTSRDHGNHLTKDEINILRDCYQVGIKRQIAADKVNCSIRVVSKYYSYFKIERQQFEEENKNKPLPKRHYVGNFEL